MNEREENDVSDEEDVGDEKNVWEKKKEEEEKEKKDKRDKKDEKERNLGELKGMKDVWKDEDLRKEGVRPERSTRENEDV